jgi:membrane protease YdiL (CAAX protease family)
MEANRITIASLIVSIGAVLCVEAAAGAMAAGMSLNPMILLGVIRLLEIALLVLVAVICGNGLSSVGLARSSAFHGFARGVLWSAGFGMSALIAHLILYAIGINGMTLIHTHLPGSLGAIGLLFLVGGVVGPAAEEIFFRGILYGFFRRWGVFVALIMSTLVFVVAHPGFPHIPATQVVGGIVFAMAYEIEGSLMAPLTIHVLGNTAIFMLSWIT